MLKITIRKMLKKDIESVSELAMLANPHATRKEYCKHILDELKENPDFSYVAASNGEVLGYAQAEIYNDVATLEDIAVMTKHQRKGLGRKLLNKELEALKLKGAKIVFAEVHYQCASAIPFYYRHDFRISGMGQDYFGMGHDAIFLERTI